MEHKVLLEHKEQQEKKAKRVTMVHLVFLDPLEIL